MSILNSRRVRAFLAGLVVLVLTASAAFAGQPTETPVDGLAIAAERSGLEVPMGGSAPSVADDETPDEDLDEDVLDEDQDEETPVEVDEEVVADGEHCVDPATLTIEVLAETNHGAIVCWAAHQDEPDEYDNHGQWVSEWARADHGSELKGLQSAKGKGQGKGQGNGQGKGG